MSSHYLKPCRRLVVSAALVVLAGFAVAPRPAAGAEKLYGIGYVVYVSRAKLAQMSKPTDAPVCVYLHGANHQNESEYDPMLRELADMTGFIVVYPTYDARRQEDANWFYYRAKQCTTNSLNGWTSIDVLLPVSGIGRSGDDFGKKIIIAGHSLGGMYALKMADELTRANVTQVRSIVLHDPSGFGENGFATMQYDTLWLEHLSAIPRSTFLLVVTSEQAWGFEASRSSSFGYNAFSGVWRSAWSSNNIYDSYKYAAWAYGPHQGMLRGSDRYDRYGAPYLHSLALGGVFNWWLPASWFSGDVDDAYDISFAFDSRFP